LSERQGPGDVAIQHAKAWTTLSQLVGAKLPLDEILQTVRKFNRQEGLFTLARLAADLANGPGGITGREARAWTVDLLAQLPENPNPMEMAVSAAVRRLGNDTAIAHAHVVFVLQQLILTHGSNEGRRPSDGQLAFLMLALNDYLPQWDEESPELSSTEASLGSMFLSTVFNTSDDPLRFLVRILGIFGGDAAGAPIASGDWQAIQIEAFGCSLEQYVEEFLAPVFLLSRTWGNNEAPVLAPAAWTKGTSAQLYERWFREASLDLATLESPAVSVTPSLALPPTFFRTPFVTMDANALCVSPWHVRDHASLGTWAKLNAAAKKRFGTESSQKFSSTFGYLFEHWCASVAREGAKRGPFKGKLIIPTATGAGDEIEDVIVLDRGRVALFSAKASLVAEGSLKCAKSLAQVVAWLRRFYLEERGDAKARGYRGGALWLLDRKIQDIRSGKYEDRGIKKNSLVIPVVVSFDNIGEAGILYKWIEEEAARLGILSARPNVRPLTVLAPDDYEALFALASRGKGVCDTLIAKTRTLERWGKMDWFLHRQGHQGPELRFPSTELAFNELVKRAIERMRDSGVLDEPAPTPRGGTKP
jgi:hypothetical protein